MHIWLEENIQSSASLRTISADLCVLSFRHRRDVKTIAADPVGKIDRVLAQHQQIDAWVGTGNTRPSFSSMALPIP